MFSDNLKARLASLALVGAILSAPGAASAGVVVKSSGPSSGSYPVGREVSDTATISLRPGDKITVLTDNGTRVLQGPGDFVVGEGAVRTRSRFSSLSRRGGSNRARTGAVRAAAPSTAATEGPQPAPNLWFVDLTASGNLCLYDFDRVRVWRPEVAAPQKYTIIDQTTQTALDVDFVETEPMRAWDLEALKLEAGRTYTITGPLPVEGEASGTPTSTTVTFVALRDEYSQQDQLAQALIDNGCTFQLARLADELEAFAEENGK